MDNKPNTGSFGAALGGSDALVEAMQRRGIDASALQQVSPAAAVENPAPTGVEGVAPASAALGQELGQPQAQPQEDSELKIALKALGGFVQSEGKLRRDVATLRGQGIA